MWFALMRYCISVFNPKSVFFATSKPLCVFQKSLFLHEPKWFWDCEFDSNTTKEESSQHSASQSHLHSKTLLYKCLHKNIVLQEILGSLKNIWSFALTVKHAKTDKRHSEAPNQKKKKHLQRETHPHPVSQSHDESTTNLTTFLHILMKPWHLPVKKSLLRWFLGCS